MEENKLNLYKATVVVENHLTGAIAYSNDDYYVLAEDFTEATEKLNEKKLLYKSIEHVVSNNKVIV